MKSESPTPALDPADMDRSASPGDDFYRYANGGWLDRVTIPPEEVRFSVFEEVTRRNEKILREILETAARDGGPPGSDAEKLGAWMASGMDEDRIEARGVTPIADELASIDALADQDAVAAHLPHLHRIGIGVPFSFGSVPDFDDSAWTIFYVAQGGLGLPERDYYLRDDDESIALQKDYREHVARMLALLGADEARSTREAGAIYAFEKQLAEESFTAVELRDPRNFANKVAVAAAEAATPGFSWVRYLDSLGVGRLDSLNLAGPRFFARFSALLRETSLEDWKAYLRWHVVRAFASTLSSPFVEESYGFNQARLSGQREMKPRWKRVLLAANADIGELLGRAFVERTFPPQAKRRCEEMVQHLTAAYRERIVAVDWMGEETKQRAIEKLDAFKSKIGYPEKWRDWSGLELRRDDWAGNRMRASAFDVAFDLAKVGKKTDPDEWGMPPQVVNAYYHPLHNEIVFPAGILQPPFFSDAYDDALNFGAMGAVIGHEITHGFDDSGSQFDAHGNLKNWWSETDRAEFQRRADVVIRQFSEYVAIDELRVNGELTLGENIADLGGVTISYVALQKALQGNAKDPIEGFTPEQRFFLAYARAWRGKYRDEALKLQVRTNPHSPSPFRCIGPLSNLQWFADAFGLEEGAKVMRPREMRAEIW